MQKMKEKNIDNKPLRVLFISRAYPPIVGGIEDQNYNLGQALKKLTPTKIIANPRGKKWLIPFVARLFLQLPFILPKYDVVLFGDGVLAPVGRVFKVLFPNKKFASVIHGLDITYMYQKSVFSKIYRRLNIPALRHLDKLIMVGNHTIKEAVKAGIPKEKCVFVPNGINVEKVYHPQPKSKVIELLTKQSKLPADYFQDKIIITRLGRFVPHKGLHWFIDQVMPSLPKKYILIGAGGYNPKAVGDEENYTLCQKYIKKHDLEKRVFLFPNNTLEEMVTFLNTTDLYISPNIEIPGSMEGFGLNVLEAAVCEKVVLASRLQGLKDAIKDGVNGLLIEPEQPQVWLTKIKEIFSPEFPRQEFARRAREYTLENFTWDKIGKKYLKVLRSL